jgi:hypothetical protein
MSGVFQNYKLHLLETLVDQDEVIDQDSLVAAFHGFIQDRKETVQTITFSIR